MAGSGGATLTTHVAHALRVNHVFLTLETDAGITGVGEGTVEYRKLAAQAAITHMKDHLVGQDPFRINHHIDTLSRDRRRCCVFEEHFSPQASEDFNGAGLLYFANFQRFIARAISKSRLNHNRVSGQEIFFFGNIRAGEKVSVALHAPSGNGMLLADIIREDGKIIAVSRHRSQL